MAFNDDVMDLEAFHDFLWKYSDSKGRVKFTIQEMADLFGMGYFSMSRILGKMVHAGRLKKPTPRSKLFYCANPLSYRMENNIVKDHRR